jgi:3-deoxy-D-manno-octulosonic-acid transferase
LVPHEINHEIIKNICEKHNGVLYTDLSENVQDARLLLINKVGLLSSIYALAHYAYIGGAFGKGLHNILEPTAFGLPLFFGNKKYSKFQEAQDLINLQVAQSLDVTENLAQKLIEVEPNIQKIQKSALNYINQKTGATDIIIKQIKTYL